MRKVKREFLALTCIAIAIVLDAGCSAHPVSGPLPPNVTFTWSGLWVQGQQNPPILFQHVGQSATLSISGVAGESPYQVSSGSCVSLSAASTSQNVSVTATTSGSCAITVKTSTGEIDSVEATVSP